MCRGWHVDKYKITLKLVINSRRIFRGPVVQKHWFRELLSCECFSCFLSLHFGGGCAVWQDQINILICVQHFHRWLAIRIPPSQTVFTIQSTVVTIGVSAFFPTECMGFAPTTFRIKTNYFRKRDFSLCQRIQTGFWSHPDLYSVGSGTASPGDYPLIRSRCYSQADNPWLCREMNLGLAFLSQSLHWMSCLERTVHLHFTPTPLQARHFSFFTNCSLIYYYGTFIDCTFQVTFLIRNTV